MNLDGAGIVNYYQLVQGNNVTTNDNSNELMMDEYHRINIPHYQRPYRWGEKDENNIMNLFHDYNSNTSLNQDTVSDYFLGATVAVEKTKDNVKYFELVDGQQRLTTIFLINYLYFILKREKIDYSILMRRQSGSWAQYIDELKQIYCQRVGTNTDRWGLFDSLKVFISSAITNRLDGDLDEEAFFSSVLSEYRNNMGINNANYTQDEEEQFLNRSIQLAEEFFCNENLTINYSRDSYNNNLKWALASVKIEISENPINISLKVIRDADENSIKATYISALRKIFDEVKKYVESNHYDNALDKITAMLTYLKEIIEHLNFCMITTRNENDAYKLFEVLNDRSFKVSALDLIKNHFYMTFCSMNTGTSNDVIDNHIDGLDKIWSGEVFKDGVTPVRDNLIEYLALVYLTQDSELDVNDAMFKHSLERNYTSNLSNYDIDSAKHDFNVFRAISIILEEFQFKYKSQEKYAKTVIVNPQFSITYKTAMLLYAMKRTAILAALINVILATYENNRQGDQERFSCFSAEESMDSFRQFVRDLKEISNDATPAYISSIHTVSFVLWKTNLLADTYKTPRNEIAKTLIANFGFQHYNPNETYYSVATANKLIEEFRDWFKNWKKGNDDFHAAILLIELFQCEKRIQDNQSTLIPGGNTYRFHAADINIDHLEPNNLSDANRNNYYCSGTEVESTLKRKEVVNSLGNMMLLDKKPNIQKSNDPMLAGINGYYHETYPSGHWMLTEILGMSSDNQYFDGTIPKDKFFEERARRLRCYLEKLLSRGDYGEACDISGI